MIPIVYKAGTTDFSTTPLGRLPDCISCTVEEKINDVYELSIKYPLDGVSHELLERENIILVKVCDGDGTDYNSDPIYQPFEIYKLTKPINRVFTAYAYHISYNGNYVVYKPLLDTPDVVGIDNLVAKLNDRSNLIDGVKNPFTFAYDSTQISDSKINYITSAPKTLRNILGGDTDSILETYKYEAEYDKYKITLKKHRGTDNGVKIAYSKNLTKFDHTEELDKVVTSVVPYYESGESSGYGGKVYAYSRDSYVQNRSGAPTFEPDTYYARNKTGGMDLLLTEPETWKSTFDDYFVKDSALDVYYKVQPTVVPYKSGKFYRYDPVNDTYILVEGPQPDYWDSQYTNYYELYQPDNPEKKYSRVANTRINFSSKTFYKKIEGDSSKFEYDILLTEPEDWIDHWADYYYYTYDPDSKYANKYATDHTNLLDISSYFQEAPTNPEAYDFIAREYMRKNKLYAPKISMSVSFVSLWQTPEYQNIANLEYVKLGDTVHVYFADYDIYSDARVTGIKYDVLTEQYDSVDLDEPEEGYAQMTANSTIKADNETTSFRKNVVTAYERDIKTAIKDLSGGDGFGYVKFNTNENTGAISSITISNTENLNTATSVVHINQKGIGIWDTKTGEKFDPSKLTAVITGEQLVIPATTTGTLDATKVNVVNLAAENIMVSDHSEDNLTDYISITPTKIVIGNKVSEIKTVQMNDRLVFADTNPKNNELIPMEQVGATHYEIPNFVPDYYYVKNDGDPGYTLLTEQPSDWNNKDAAWDEAGTHASTKYYQNKAYAYIADERFYTNDMKVQTRESLGIFQKYISTDNSMILIKGGS